MKYDAYLTGYEKTLLCNMDEDAKTASKLRRQIFDRARQRAKRADQAHLPKDPS